MSCPRGGSSAPDGVLAGCVCWRGGGGVGVMVGRGHNGWRKLRQGHTVLTGRPWIDLIFALLLFLKEPCYLVYLVIHL